MDDFRDRCNFLTFHFSEKLFCLSKVLVCGDQRCTFQQQSSSLTLKDHVITSVTLGSFCINFLANRNAFVFNVEPETNWQKKKKHIPFVIKRLQQEFGEFWLYSTAILSLLHTQLMLLRIIYYKPWQYSLQMLLYYNYNSKSEFWLQGAILWNG